VFDATSGKFAAALILTCLLHACTGCSRVSETHSHLQSKAEAKEGAASPTPKVALASCPSSPVPMLQSSAPGTGHHKVFLSWSASASTGPFSTDPVRYCLYRTQTEDTAKNCPRQGDCEQVNVVPLLNTRCVDDLVKDQTTYHYIAIAINSAGTISSPTNEAIAKIPPVGRQRPAPSDGASYSACRVPSGSRQAFP
jgi:hypothetical protein